MRPSVLLEVGDARATPSVPRDLSSSSTRSSPGSTGSGRMRTTGPEGCSVHPLVTLLEKLDALQHRVPLTASEPAAFVRHFEDAARIVEAEAALPPLEGYSDAKSLAADLLARHIRATPRSDDPAFALAPGARTDAIRHASDAIAPMFWASG